jgi:hypothetical protein
LGPKPPAAADTRKASEHKQFDQAIAILEDARRRGELPKYLEKALDDLLPRLGMRRG